MPNLEIKFTTKRFHATPWEHHVNEGAIEWPPSPWRLLRAFVATWHLKLRNKFPDRRAVAQLIDKLAQSPPAFELPKATTSHTRHYVPVNEGGKEKSEKIFDTFIHTDQPLRLRWEAELTDANQTLLSRLCKNIVYLGRGEAIVEIRLMEAAEDIEANAYPLSPDASLSKKSKLVKVLCPMEAREYRTWREGFESGKRRVEETKAIKGTKRTKKAKLGKAFILPEDLFDALHADTAVLQKQGWPLPPGARFVDYARPRIRAAARSHRRQKKDPTVARFAVNSAVLPRITRAISLADRVHAALLSRFRESAAPPVFTGRDPDGTPRQKHEHCQILCEANDTHDRITHITLFAKMKFGEKERAAIESLTKVWGHGGHDVRLVLLGFGDATTFPDCQPLNGGNKSSVWESFTPFVATRHPKTYRDGRPKLDENDWWIGSPEHDLCRLLFEQGFPRPAKLERIQNLKIGQRRLRSIQFQTVRKSGNGRRAIHPPFGFRIVFPQPVAGPIAVGYGAHFSLGLFCPEKASVTSLSAADDS